MNSEKFRQALNDLWYAKISPQGFFNEMEIVMFPNDKLSFSTKNFDFKVFETFLKAHVETHELNQICFPDNCWKLKKYLTKDNSRMKEWLDFTPSISTDIKLGQGGHYNLPLNLLKNKPKGAVEKIEKKKPDWWYKWVASRSYQKKYGKS